MISELTTKDNNTISSSQPHNLPTSVCRAPLVVVHILPGVGLGISVVPVFTAVGQGRDGRDILGHALDSILCTGKLNH